MTGVLEPLPPGLDWAALDLTALQARCDEAMREVTIVGSGGVEPLRVDPVPREIDGAQWDALAAGLVQRLAALEAFLVDPSVAVRAGVVPAELVDGCLFREPGPAPCPVPVGVYGPDVVRVADGSLAVLEDNLRTPTLMGYAQAARVAVQHALGPHGGGPQGAASAGGVMGVGGVVGVEGVVATGSGPRARRSLDRAAVGSPVPVAGRVPGSASGTAPGLAAPRPLVGFAEALGPVLRAAAPELDDPVLAVLGDDRGSNVRWEPELLAGQLGLPVVGLDELTARGDRLLLPDGRAVDVLWRRTSEERLLGDDGGPNRYGTALLPGLASGRLRVVNPFGTGLADDKRTHAYVEDLIRLHLGEQPLLRSVRTFDLGDPAHRAAALSQLDRCVVKPRSGSGGRGVVALSEAGPAERAALRRTVLADPAGWVAQEQVELSCCPTVVTGRLAPRRVDLRPCVVSDGQTRTVLSGGLTRVALGASELVVNYGRGGAVKDTRVVDRSAG